MKISKTHYQLLDYTQDDEALSNPQKYLGPNCEEVLRFWNHLDKMTLSQLNAVGEKFFSIINIDRDLISFLLTYTIPNTQVNITPALLHPAIKFEFSEELMKSIILAASCAATEIILNVQNPVILPHFNYSVNPT